jgi:hypothetical protein
MAMRIMSTVPEQFSVRERAEKRGPDAEVLSAGIPDRHRAAWATAQRASASTHRYSWARGLSGWGCLRKEISKALQAVLTDKSAPVYGEHDREVLKADIMDYLVIRALEKCGVDGDDRPEAPSGQTRGERDCMLLCNADIVETFREAFRKAVKACAFLHGGGDRNDLRVAPCKLCKA